MQLDMGLMLHTGDMPCTDIVRLAQEAETLGYHGFWLTEESGKEAFSLAALIARETERIRIGTAIVNFYARSPMMLAMAARTLDEISGGRFGPFGLGTGGIGFTQRGHGVEIDRPIARARETVEIVRGYLTQNRFSYPQGKWFRPDDFRLREGPLGEGRVELYLAALGPQMAEMAGKVSDGMIANWLTPETLAIYRDRIARGAAGEGRDPSGVRIATLDMMCADHTDEESVQAMRRGIAFYCASPHYHRVADASGFGDAVRKVYDVWQSRDYGRATGLVTDALMQKFSVTGDDAVATAHFEWMKREGAYPIIYPVPRPSAMVEDHFLTMRNAARAASRV